MTGTFSSNDKLYKSNMDVVHMGIEYRMTAAIEIDKKLSVEQVAGMLAGNQGNLTFLRLKIRQNYLLVGTYEASFTRVFEVSEYSGKDGKDEGRSKETLKTMQTTILSYINSQDKDLAELKASILGRMESYHEAKHEIELEYKNIQSLMNNYYAMD